MKQTLFHALGGAALAFLLFLAPMSGALAQNTITITPATTIAGSDVCGNSADTVAGDCDQIPADGGPDGNTLTIESGVTLPRDAVGRQDFRSSVDTFANGNNVIVSGTVDTALGGHVGDATNFRATGTGNQVSINTGAVALEATGVYINPANNSIVSATQNRVQVLGGSVENIFGADVYCNNSSADVSNNTISITGGRAGSSDPTDYQSEIAAGSANAVPNCAVSVSGNTVSITGGTVAGAMIYGGEVFGNSTFSASGNTVLIGAGADIGPEVYIYGGSVNAGGTSENNSLYLQRSGVTLVGLDSFQNLVFSVPANMDLENGAMLTVDKSPYLYSPGTANIPNATISVAIAGGLTLDVGDRIVLINALTLTGGNSLNPDVSSLTDGYGFGIVSEELANNKLVVEVTAVPQPDPPTPPPPPPPPPTYSDGDSLDPGSSHVAPYEHHHFCLGGDIGSPPVTLRIDDVHYTITPRADNTCFEVFPIVRRIDERALILRSGIGDVSSASPGKPLLQARNTDLVLNESHHLANKIATIRARLDPICTSTRVTRLEGEISAPEWITRPMPSKGCPDDALTPEQESFQFPGKLACNPSALRLHGTYLQLTVKRFQPLCKDQQFYVVAGNEIYSWWQNNRDGWAPLEDPFLPLETATETCPMTITLVDALDIRLIPGIELYIGYGSDADEMMMNQRYCGVFRAAP